MATATATLTAVTTNHDIPPPSAQALHLIAALSNPQPPEVHRQALQARDEALSASLDSYNQLCLQLALCVVACDEAPSTLWQRLDPTQQASLQQHNPSLVAEATATTTTPAAWVPLGQMAGLVLKNALIRPPLDPTKSPVANSNNNNNNGTLLVDPSYTMQITTVAQPLQQVLLRALTCRHAPLRAVASSVIAATAVANQQQPNRRQPQQQVALHLSHWPQLIPTLLDYMKTSFSSSSDHHHQVHGALATVQKLLEDGGPDQVDSTHLDLILPVVLQFLTLPPPLPPANAALEKTLLYCLEIMVVILAAWPHIPNALVVPFPQYLAALGRWGQATTNPKLKALVCRNLVTLLELWTEYVRTDFPAILQFILQATNTTLNNNNTTIPQPQTVEVALQACEFWFVLGHMDDTSSSSSSSNRGITAGRLTPDMMEHLQAIVPQLIPLLLHNMVYQPDQRVEILARNELDLQQENHANTNMRPVFHRSRAAVPGVSASSNNNNHADEAAEDDPDDDDDDIGDDDDGYEQDDENGFDDDDDGNEWTLRKSAAASLDGLANLLGAACILPPLLPDLERGLASTDPWIQEASILALGAIAEGCREEMNAHMGQLHPYLLNHLAVPEESTPPQQQQQQLPQVKAIAAWTLGRYAPWAVEQVQSGQRGTLLADLTQVCLARLTDRNRRVQVAVCSAFGVVVDAAGDLMVPYLDPVYRGLVQALAQYEGRSLLLVLDVFGVLADCCGPAIAEGDLPTLYVPALLEFWRTTAAATDPANQTLLPLMEALASTAMSSGMNFQPYALECFEMAMGTIEAVQLSLTTAGEKIIPEEAADPIVCATDLLDGLVEGVGGSFAALVASSQRFGQHFLSVLHGLCRHDVAGVRMSALALVGDLARRNPALLQPALVEIVKELIQNMDAVQPSVCTNAVWALGEICVQAAASPQGPALLQPFAPPAMQNLVALLAGNGSIGGSSRGTEIPGLAANAAACVGRLALVDPALVAPDLARCLLGWCDGLAKITDPTERHDAFQGFVKVVYANPQAIPQAAVNVADALVSVLFAIVAWHMPSELPEDSTQVLTGTYEFRPFPVQEAELGTALVQLVKDMKASVGADVWLTVEKVLPVNVRRLLREQYQL